ncbi:MAG TPA: hypothetical protein VNP03_09685 [Pseudonocardia sp.]|nr:hypothetical protein [Pseudonocardia sp.]
MTESSPTDLPATRRALHGVAELLLAGPQYRTGGLIRLRITPGGFSTVASPELRVDGEQLVAGSTRLPMAGRSYAELAEGVGVEAGAPSELYADGSGVDPSESVTLDPAAARTIVAAFALGDAALRDLAPDAEPVLWPEHFDVGITVLEVNYGVSPGDGYLAEPYAYVGPHHPRRGAFWNAPFGATRPVAALADVAGALRFFREGRDRASD